VPGCAKQELFSDRNRLALAPAVLVGFGAASTLLPYGSASATWVSRAGSNGRFVWDGTAQARGAHLLRDPEFLKIVAMQAFAKR